MSSARSWWQNTKAMPLVLRMLCQGCMVVPPLLGVLLVLPLFDWTVNGRQVSYAELWSSGAGPVMLVVMVVCTAAAWGSAARFPWARWAFVAAPLLPLAIAAVLPRTWFTEQATADPATWVSALVVSCFALAGLFLVPSVRQYYQASNAKTDA
jgi:hypothetical protein